MRYVIVTVAWCAARGILLIPEMRKSLDGTKVILHDNFVSQFLSEDEKSSDDFRTYAHDDAEFREILASPDWTPEEGAAADPAKREILPDYYTVVAIRKILNKKGVDSSFAAKSLGAGKGAFLLENGSADTYCYGQVTSNLGPFPPIFIYQTKTSYCGKTITPGTGTDTENDILCLFRKRVNQASDYYKCVFYDLRIYDHSLTAEELQTVKDEMMSDYEKNAKPLEGITYVADWDAKGRYN